MKRNVAALIYVALSAGTAISQSVPTQSSGSSSSGRVATTASSLLPGSVLQAELAKSLDVRKNKAGDEVTARVTHDLKSDGSIVVPKGSKLSGHVIEVKVRTKSDAHSELRLTFNRVTLKDNTEIPVQLRIQAIGRPRTAPTGEDDLASGTASVAPGGLLGGVGSTTTGAVSDVGSTAHSTGLTATSQGVVGLRGLTVSTQASASSEEVAITSSTGDVHLDSGTEIVLRVTP